MPSGSLSTIEGRQLIVNLPAVLPSLWNVTIDGSFRLERRRWGVVVLEGFRSSDGQGEAAYYSQTLWVGGVGRREATAYASRTDIRFRLVGYWNLAGIPITWFYP
jgi:hypothetical protein